MITHTFLFRSVLLFNCAVLIMSCSPSQATVDEPQPEFIYESTPTPAVSIAGTLPQVTETAVPTVLPSPTPIPWTTKPITTDNLSNLKLVNQWGRGTVLKMEMLKNMPGHFLVLTPLGVYWYASNSLLTFVPDADDFILSSDETILAVSLKNGDVQIWTTQTTSLRQTIVPVFSEEDKQIEYWDEFPFYVAGMALSNDGSQIAVGYVNGKIDLWRIGEENAYATLVHDSLSLWETDTILLHELSFSPDGKTFVAFKFPRNSNANRVTFWSLPDATLLAVSDAGRYYQFPKNAYLPAGNTLLTFSRKDSYLNIDLWDVATGKLLNKFGTGLTKIESLDIVEAGDAVTLLGSDAQGTHYNQVRKLSDGKLTLNEKVDQLPVDPDVAAFEEFLFTEGHYTTTWGDDPVPQSARIVSAESMLMQIKLEEHILSVPDASIQPSILPENVLNAFYDPRGNFIAWCEPGKLNIRDKDGTVASVKLLLNSACDGLTVSQKKNYAAIWYGSALYVINVNTAEHKKASFDMRFAGEVMLTAGFSQDEQMLISSKDALVSVWQVEPFQRWGDSHQAERYMGRNVDIELSSDKAVAVSLSVGDGTTQDRLSQLMVWRLPDAFLLHRINLPFVGSIQPMFTAFSLSPDGAVIASGDDFGGIRFWSAQTGEELYHYEVSARPLDMEFTSDGSGLVIVLADGTILLLGVG